MLIEAAEAPPFISNHGGGCSRHPMCIPYWCTVLVTRLLIGTCSIDVTVHTSSPELTLVFARSSQDHTTELYPVSTSDHRTPVYSSRADSSLVQPNQ